MADGLEGEANEALLDLRVQTFYKVNRFINSIHDMDQLLILIVNCMGSVLSRTGPETSTKAATSMTQKDHPGRTLGPNQHLPDLTGSGTIGVESALAARIFNRDTWSPAGAAAESKRAEQRRYDQPELQRPER